MPRKKFKRYHARPDVGKGSERREASLPEQAVGEKWCIGLGHLVRYGFCLNCGRTEEEINQPHN